MIQAALETTVMSGMRPEQAGGTAKEELLCQPMKALADSLLRMLSFVLLAASAGHSSVCFIKDHHGHMQVQMPSDRTDANIHSSMQVMMESGKQQGTSPVPPWRHARRTELSIQLLELLKRPSMTHR